MDDPGKDKKCERLLDRVVTLARRRAELREEDDRLEREIATLRREIARLEGGQ